MSDKPYVAQVTTFTYEVVAGVDRNVALPVATVFLTEHRKGTGVEDIAEAPADFAYTLVDGEGNQMGWVKAGCFNFFDQAVREAARTHGRGADQDIEQPMSPFKIVPV